jgi:phosphoenolpyruvate carboxylase
VAKQSGFFGQTLHCVGARIRVTGNGNLVSTLYSLDDVRSQGLQDIVMASPNRIEPTILANFQEQRMKIRLETTVIDEIFNISRIVLFIKPVAESYPIR